MLDHNSACHVIHKISESLAGHRCRERAEKTRSLPRCFDFGRVVSLIHPWFLKTSWKTIVENGENKITDDQGLWLTPENKFTSSQCPKEKHSEIQTKQDQICLWVSFGSFHLPKLRRSGRHRIENAWVFSTLHGLQMGVNTRRLLQAVAAATAGAPYACEKPDVREKPNDCETGGSNKIHQFSMMSYHLDDSNPKNHDDHQKDAPERMLVQNREISQSRDQRRGELKIRSANQQ